MSEQSKKINKKERRYFKYLHYGRLSKKSESDKFYFDFKKISRLNKYENN
jgi:hypothetical protein